MTIKQTILHKLGLCHKSRAGYNCLGNAGECGKPYWKENI